MTEKRQVYRCLHCGNTVVIVGDGEGVLVCCGAKMQLMKEQTADFKTEKHVPIVEKIASGIKVKVGSIPHPMEENHYIQWIELFADGISYQKLLEPHMAPEVFFPIAANSIELREICNVHGLWKN